MSYSLKNTTFDKQFINKDTISLYANTNEAFIEGEVRGIVIELPGLGGGSCLGGNMDRADYSSERAKDFAKNGIVIAYMFPGPWSWGNSSAVRMSDAVIDAIIDKYSLKNPPIAICGGSMGGVGSLMVSANTRHALSCVAVACPCVDILACFDCHPDFPRTLISAIASYDTTLEDGLKAISPIENIDKLKKVPYFICSDGADEIFPESQCNNFVDRMQSKGFDVIYRKQPNLKHGGFFPEVRNELHDFILKSLLH